MIWDEFMYKILVNLVILSFFHAFMGMQPDREERDSYTRARV
ncbi:unnamed protein product [marine sediment metagenome]|uniref:Uncharacterized protein n=1 Tax=marine sediment metagenome TaxID=412755 RepID=X0VDW7_9ZZZZ